MSVSLVVIFLSAALLHSFWNTVVKGAGDKTIALGMIALGHMIPEFTIVLIMPSPGWHVWPYVVASTVIHWGYNYFLNVAYKLGDLSAMYSIARGLAPVLIAVGAQVWVGETLSPLAWSVSFVCLPESWC